MYAVKHNDDSVSIKDNHAVSKRLQKEFMSLMMTTEKGISAFPDGENICKWIGTITGLYPAKISLIFGISKFLSLRSTRSKLSNALFPPQH